MPTTATQTSNNQTIEVQNADHLSATEAAMEHFREYARQKPETVALWALGIGFVLGWKLKPW